MKRMWRRYWRSGTRSQVVQVIGKMIVLYRPAKEEKDRKIVLPQ